MLRLGNCELHGCCEDAIGCTDDGDFYCEDHLFEWGCSQETIGDDYADLPLDDDETDFPDAEVELLDTALFDR
jgi:hypothetical protein